MRHSDNLKQLVFSYREVVFLLELSVMELIIPFYYQYKWGCFCNYDLSTYMQQYAQ